MLETPHTLCSPPSTITYLTTTQVHWERCQTLIQSQFNIPSSALFLALLNSNEFLNPKRYLILILMAVWKAELYIFDKFSTESHHNSSTADSSPTWVCSVWSPFPIFYVILGALHLIGRCSATCATPPVLPCVRYFWIGSCKLFAQGWLIFPGLASNHDPPDPACKKTGLQAWVTGPGHHFLSWNYLVMALCIISLLPYQHHLIRAKDKQPNVLLLHRTFWVLLTL
jgi:hypothetical protein